MHVNLDRLLPENLCYACSSKTHFLPNEAIKIITVHAKYMEPGVDHGGDDPVEVDEEWRYFRKVPEVGSNEKVQQEKKKTESSKNVTEATDPEAVPSDEATMM